MSYLLPCPCGRKVVVTAAQAGCRIACECGQEVEVPSLSRLRELAGLGAYESGVLDTIAGMIERGELPPDEFCALSRRPTTGQVLVRVQAERVVRGQGTSKWELLTLVLLGGIFGVILGQFDKPSPERGRDTVIDVPLRIHPSQRARLRHAGQRRLRRLLRTVPVYARMLDDYTDAYLQVVEEPGPGKLDAHPLADDRL